MQTIKEKEKKAYEVMKESFGYKNTMAAPHLTKIIVAVGTGRLVKNDKNKNDFVSDRIAKITGQKPSVRGAKKSIAGFKIRTGDLVGMMTTLRGKTMYDFADKLVNIAIPRTKDFRGIERKVVDDIGNMTIGIKEHTIFPETGDEEIRDVFGLAVTFVTTAKTKKEGTQYFELIGIPFKA
ncbi:MAG: 50S ribosomal protein L5 [Candidatus Pacebacteria bacterium]|nr:50S ribosomal protein L5 [Candidatus Paceibacterota bacterium]